MITVDHPLIQLLALIEMVWIDAEPGQVKRGGPKLYSEKAMFKAYVAGQSLQKEVEIAGRKGNGDNGGRSTN